MRHATVHKENTKGTLVVIFGAFQLLLLLQSSVIVGHIAQGLYEHCTTGQFIHPARNVFHRMPAAVVPRGQENGVTPCNDRADGNFPVSSVDNGEKKSVGSSDSPALKKRVGVFTGVSLIIGTMIGSGIFISPSGLAAGSGSVGLSLVLWTVCGIISMLGALCLAELGTLITESGGEYAYLKAAFGSVPAFMFSWMSMMLLKPASCCIIALTCAEYLMVPIFDDGCGKPPDVNKKLFAAVVILLLTAVNSLSVNLAARIQVLFTAAKILALIIIIIGGMVKIGQGETKYLASAFEGSRSSVGPLAIGIYNGMWAFDGWNNLNYVTEELISPYKNLPRCILIAIPLCTVLYLLVNISYFSVMSVDDLISSHAVAVTWADRTVPVARMAIPIVVAMSTFGALNGSMFGTGRLTYVAARDGHMVMVFSFVHMKNHTPLPSLIFTCTLALIFLIPGDIGSLIDVFNFAVWLFYGLTMLALIVLRYTHKDQYRPYKVPIIFPVVVLAVAVFLVVAPIADNPQVEFLYAGLFIIGGLIFYVPFVYFKKTAPCMDYITMVMQLVMQVTPPRGEPAN